MSKLATGLRSGLPGRLTSKLGEKFEFYKGWCNSPKTIGAIAPTSAAMARIMASVVRPDSNFPVLELGPGTGAVTKAILERGIKPSNLVSVEFSEIFLPSLNSRFPGVRFVHGDAFDISGIAERLGVERFDAVVSSLPLLNSPVNQRVRLVESVLDLLEPGRPMVQFSYKLGAPVPAWSKNTVVDHMTTVLRNLPPARIWTYRRRPQANGKSPFCSSARAQERARN